MIKYDLNASSAAHALESSGVESYRRYYYFGIWCERETFAFQFMITAGAATSLIAGGGTVVPGTTAVAPRTTVLKNPTGIVVNGAGNIYLVVGDTGNATSMKSPPRSDRSRRSLAALRFQHAFA